MGKGLRVILFFLVFCVITEVCYCGTEVPLIPRETLFGNPVKTSPQISPHGKMLAYLAPVDNVLNVWIKTIGKDDDSPLTKDTNRGVLNYFWAQDNVHILYLQDKDGDENWRLYGVNVITRETRNFTPFDNVQVQVIAHDKHFPDELLLGMNQRDVKIHDAYHLKIS